MRHFATVFLCVFGLASSVKSLDPEQPPMDGPGPEGPFDAAQMDSEWISWAGEFEGDMKLTQSQLRQLNASSSERNGQVSERSRWPNAVIPYVISGDFASEGLAKIEAAFASYASNTCIRMVKRTTETDYVNIVREGGCWSYVGRIGGVQKVSLASGCVWNSIIIHEFMHAAGFFHEQSRTDRDTYVRIALENIQDGKEGNFNKYSASQITPFGEPYDYQSVMHYGAYAFSKNGQKTIERLDGSDAGLGNSDGFSQVDINKLNAMYQCDTTATTAATTTAATTTAATTTADPSSCSDVLSSCSYWAKYDYCTYSRHYSYMTENCQKTCNQCAGDCKDDTTYATRCPYWSKYYCTTGNYVGFMTKYCPKSCDVC